MNLALSQDLFYTEYGILDISPFRGLHDRSLRALANMSSFLSSGCPDDFLFDSESFSSLFFNFSGNDLIEKCSEVVSDPVKHRELSSNFSKKYESSYHYHDFMRSIFYASKIRWHN